MERCSYPKSLEANGKSTKESTVLQAARPATSWLHMNAHHVQPLPIVLVVLLRTFHVLRDSFQVQAQILLHNVDLLFLLSSP